LVVHYQISEEAVQRLEEVMKQALAEGGQKLEDRVGYKAYG
jgi:hypothetical protein